MLLSAPFVRSPCSRRIFGRSSSDGAPGRRGGNRCRATRDTGTRAKRGKIFKRPPSPPSCTVTPEIPRAERLGLLGCTVAPEGPRVNRVGRWRPVRVPKASVPTELHSGAKWSPCTPSRTVAPDFDKEREIPVQSGLSLDRDHRANSSSRDERAHGQRRPDNGQGSEAGPRTLDDAPFNALIVDAVREEASWPIRSGRPTRSVEVRGPNRQARQPT